jgi:hypothetical protein
MTFMMNCLILGIQKDTKLKKAAFLEEIKIENMCNRSQTK